MSVVFFVNGALFANWVARVPAVKDAVDAGTGALGVALLGLAVGSLLTMPVAGRLCERFGSNRVVVASGVASAVALQMPAHVASPVALGVALIAYGAAFGMLDVAMNVQAVAVVRRLRRPVMPSFHAAFSLGGLAGAVLGAGAAALGWSPARHFAAVTVLAAGTLLAARPHLLPPALGYAAFSIAMTVGRFGGERVINRLGPARVLRAGGIAAASGIVAAVVVPSPAVALAGFAVVGIGFSCAFPVALTAAGESGSGSGGPEIAAVSMIGYLGFLGGPPLIGLLAEVVGLRIAILTIALAGAGLAALGGDPGGGRSGYRSRNRHSERVAAQ